MSTQQQLLDDPAVTDVDWSTDTATGEVFTSMISYDALNRPVSMTDPGGNVTEHTYDAGGMLLTVTLNSDDYVTDIHYDAKGQRMKVWYGNGTKTCYTYDEQTFRLRELKTRRLSDSALLQELHYYYDPVGNITSITDGAQQDIFYANTIVTADQSFTYDALYRLIEATGREQIGTASFGSDDNYNDSAWISNLGSDASQTYIQYYTYDAVGNITELQHAAGTGSYTRSYDHDSSSNRLDSTAIGATTYSYTYDDRGNMLTMPHLSALDWNAQNQLSHTERGTTDAYYQYSGGQRIRKWVDKGGGLIEERIYLGSYERYRKYVSTTTLDVERSTVHISDDTGRIAMTEVLNTDYNSDGADEVLIRYSYSNHLQNASLELNEDGDIISYEEYHPYGTTAWQAKSTSINATAKRYRYTGKERDEETGLYYHGARYYIPWLCRWSAVDPLESKYAPWSSYNYGFDNPVKWNDSTGMGPDLWSTAKNDVPKVPAASDIVKVKNDEKPVSSISDIVSEEEIQLKTDSSHHVQKHNAKHTISHHATRKVPELLKPNVKANIDINSDKLVDKFLHPWNVQTVSKTLLEHTSSSNDNFDEAVQIVLAHEGGWKNDPAHDPGDPTNKGISWPTWKSYAKSLLNVDPTVKNLINLTTEQAIKIYKEVYWKERGFDKFNDSGLALQIYDWTITSGGAIKEIQKLLNKEFGKNISTDGALGPQTIDAINSVNQDQLYNRIQDIRVDYYNYLYRIGKIAEKNIGGLLNRAHDFKKR